jgi:hypothetical protein
MLTKPLLTSNISISPLLSCHSSNLLTQIYKPKTRKKEKLHHKRPGLPGGILRAKSQRPEVAPTPFSLSNPSNNFFNAGSMACGAL